MLPEIVDAYYENTKGRWNFWNIEAEEKWAYENKNC